MQKVQFMFIVSLVFAIIVTIFALTNSTPVVISLFFYKLTASQALVIFISAALGAIIVTSLGIVNHIKLKSQIRALHKQNAELSERLMHISEEPKTDALPGNAGDEGKLEAGKENQQ